MSVTEADKDALLERVPTEGRGVGNRTLMQLLGWPEEKYLAVRDSMIEAGVLARGPGRGGSVKRSGAANEEKEFLEHIPKDGSTIGNSVLQRALGWNEERYYAVRDRLLDEGVLARGRGRGGTVRLVQVEVRAGEPRPRVARPTTPRAPDDREAALYTPIAHVLDDDWAKDRRFRWWKVEETAKQGRRETGGRWTRPDLAVISLNKFQYLPGSYLDVWTFEVKTIDGIDVTAVYEALAHGRAATRAYVLVKVPEELSDDQKERLETVEAEAARHKIGVYRIVDPADFSTWEETVEASRLATDPESLNEFIGNQFSPDVQSDLLLQIR